MTVGDGADHMKHDDGWTDYYDEHEAREPRPMLLDVLATFDQPGRAVDIGFGNGIETVAMLERGWDVLAVDAEPEALERLQTRLAGSHERLRTQLARVENVELPTVDLVWAAFSLFFCDRALFPEVWARIGRAIRPGGRFAGQLLGNRDTWAGDEGISAFDDEAAQRLFDGWSVERFEEEDFDGEACSGPKHWHLFHVVAQRPA
jgi:tellurite methyltransferase